MQIKGEIMGYPDYPAGIDFDYSVWTAGTRLDLINVNWDNTYRDVVRFDSRDALNQYVNSRAGSGITIEQMTYAKPGEDVYLNIPYNRANRFNYLRASNPLMPSVYDDIQKDFYYFILECEYVNAGVTRVKLQLDIWQTYVYDVTWGNCYIERGHLAVANANKFANYGRTHLTVPEGLDIGAQYRQIVKRTEEIVGFEGIQQKTNVLVVSTVDLFQDPGTKENPNNNTGPGSTISGLASGATFYAFESPQSFSSFLNAIEDTPWIGQGIVSVTAVPELDRYMPLGSGISWQPSGVPTHIASYWPYPVKHKLFNNWRNDAGLHNFIPGRYEHVKWKFFTFPYMMIELTTWSGNPIVLRPEAWNDPDAFILERVNYVPPTQRVQITPRRYNSNGQPIEPLFNVTYEELISIGFSPAAATNFLNVIAEMGDDGGDYLDMLTQISDFPTMPIVNNMSISYLASNANTLSYQRSSADWSQQRALAGAQANFDVATGAIQANQDYTNINSRVLGAQTANNANALTQQSGVNALASLGGGLAGGAFGPAGLAAGVANGAANAAAGIANAQIQNQANNANASAQMSGMQDTTTRQNQQAGLSRDTNVDLARFGAKGDYANAIAGINAKVQDAEMIQPSVSGQFGGDHVNLANGTMEVSLRWKLLDDANMKIVGEYWLRYGWAMRIFATPPQDLKAMTKFTYWKMSETYIAAAGIPEGHKYGLRGIMEKGTTVWANPGDIGQIDMASNAPLEGIAY
jgi:hypothetical protein